jgi:SOS-response transcriptional repressor LexA
MRFGDWLQNQLDRKEWSQSDLARVSGLSTTTISKYIAGPDKPSRLKTILSISRALAVPVVEVQAAIRGEEDLQPARRSRAELRAEFDATEPIEIPLIKDLVAHMGAGGGFVDDYVYLSPSSRRRSHRHIRAIRARGDCMIPEIADGDVVIFDMDAEYHPRDVVVAKADGHAVVRRLMEVAGRMVLRADATGDTHVLTEEDQIYGKVIATQRSFGAT